MNYLTINGAGTQLGVGTKKPTDIQFVQLPSSPEAVDQLIAWLIVNVKVDAAAAVRALQPYSTIKRGALLGDAFAVQFDKQQVGLRGPNQQRSYFNGR